MHLQLPDTRRNHKIVSSSRIFSQSLADGHPSRGAVYPHIPEELIFGNSQLMQGIRGRLQAVAQSNVPVLIQGESGTGKEVLARLIHESSAVQTGPFVRVSCPAIPPTLFESELFGYEKGAFTGAHSRRAGRVAVADGGTLFLDEIGELDFALQAKLLQLLQDGRFCPIGAEEETQVQIRVMCATNCNLDRQIANGAFRQDLFYRINVVTLHLPPLRQRTDDVPELVDYFIKLYNDEFNCRAPGISRELLTLLKEYHWPGNIRQLENLIKRYVIMGSEEAISRDLLANYEQSHRFSKTPEVTSGASISLKKVTKDMVQDFERHVIMSMLQAHSGNRVRAARALNISYRALLYKLKGCRLPSPTDSSASQ
jgi:two-component system, NtrC family, response regulator AtoC